MITFVLVIRFIKILTSRCIMRLNSVRNSVTTSETRPGIAVKGMMKLTDEIITIDTQGK